jgi:citrate lyase subunit beta/citryl-CoA lyase
VWLRVNAVDSAWFDDDLRLACEPGLAGIVLPKAEAVPNTLLCLLQQRRIGGVVALIETAEGLRCAREIGATPGVRRLAFGALDFQVDLGIDGDDDELLFFRSHLVWQSRLAGLPAPIDGVATVIDDEAMVRAQAFHSRRLGFGARLCIHPRQLAAVHAAFTPSAVERTWAARVLAALEASGGAAVAVDGRMVDRPVQLQAQRIASATADGRPARRYAS